MTLKEAVADLKSQTKPYEQIKPTMPQGTFANTIKAIEYGFAKPKTITDFMSKFGYNKIIQVEQWEKSI